MEQIDETHTVAWEEILGVESRGEQVYHILSYRQSGVEIINILQHGQRGQQLGRGRRHNALVGVFADQYLSIYLLAFIHAGSGVFHQIESWSPAKSRLCQLALLYTAYVLCYVLNDWLPFEPLAIAIFTAVFGPIPLIALDER